MKTKTEYIEGPEAWNRFEGAMKKVIAVPYDEIQLRLESERKASARALKARPVSIAAAVKVKIEMCIVGLLESLKVDCACGLHIHRVERQGDNVGRSVLRFKRYRSRPA